MATSSYIPMSQRSTWSDIEPIPQNDGPSPLVPIIYAEDYRDAMDYFRGISAAEEYSERGLELTETIIRRNPAHYTVWNFRLTTLLKLGKDLNDEMELMNEFARTNLKSYQVWHHRLQLMTQLDPQNPQGEIDYIHDSLIPDTKNYHTWAYLHWLYSHFYDRITEDQWKDENAWCEELLRADGRNNSAWSWRWYLKVGRPGAQPDKAEVDYAIAAVKKIPHNVSAWNYLRALIDHLSLSRANYVEEISNIETCQALEFKAEALEEGRDQAAAQIVYKELSVKDPIRAAYWTARAAA